MRKIFTIALFLSLYSAFSQGGYEIKVSIKNFNDSVAYLAKYNFGKQYLVDTCKKVIKGNIVFKGKMDLDKGIYFLVNQQKAHMFDFILNENTKLNFTSDMADLQYNLKSVGSKENEDFFAYTRFYMDKNKAFAEVRNKTKGMNKEDSAKFVSEKVKEFTKEVNKFEADVLVAQKGKFFGDWLNLKTEKEIKDADMPRLKNATDSAFYRFNYYKNHFWDGVNFSDDRLLRTQFLETRVNKYFEQLIQQLGPDSLIVEMDKLLGKCPPQSEMFKYMFVYFMVNYENPKLMGFDKVFVHLVDNYIKTNKAAGIYDEKTVQKIIEKSDKTKPLLIGAVAPELLLIDTINGKAVGKMGFDTAQTSESVSQLYYKNMQKITPMFKSLSSIKAKYTILVFWDVDCGHCQTEMPKLVEVYHDLKKKTDVQIVAVYTLQEFEKWRKYIVDKKLDFIHLYDPVYINGMKTKYDIFSTPKVFILDEKKVIIAKHMPVEKIPELIEIHESKAKKVN